MGAKRQYTAEFLVGAKLLASFKGAMAQAQQRLQALEKTASAAGKSVLKFGSLFSTLFAGLAAFGVGAIFKKIFEGANEAAADADKRTRSLTAALMEQNFIRARGRDYAMQQVAELGKHNDALVRQGVVSRELLELGESQLAITRLGPQAIADTIPLLSDALVAFKGVNASAEDMQTLSKGFGVAVQRGMTKPLTQFGIIFTDREQKLFKQMTRQERYNELTRRFQKLAGESARALNTPLGKIHALDNRIAEMSRHIGEATLVARGEMADAWSGALEQLEPIFERIGKAAAHAAAWAGREMSDMVKAFSTPAAKKTFGDFEAAVKGIASTVVPATEKGKSLGTMFGDWWTKQTKDFTSDLIAGEAGIVRWGNAWAKFWTDFKAGWSTYIQPALNTAYKKMAEWIQLVSNDNINKALQKIGSNIKEFLENPIIATINRFKEFLILTGKAMPTSAADLMVQPPAGAVSAAQTATTAGAYGGGGGGAAGAAARSAFGAGAGPAAGAAAGAGAAAAGATLPVTVASYGGPAEPGQKTGSYNNRLGPGDVAISPNLIASLGVPSPSNYVMLDGQRYHVADTSWYHKNQPTSNMVEIWGYGNQIKRSGTVAKAYQMGGIVNRMTHALLGERGPEAIIPLTGGGARARGLLGMAARALGMGGGGSSTAVNFAPHVEIHGGASEKVVEMLEAKLRDVAREFVTRFKSAQSHERRLSYEGGYG